MANQRREFFDDLKNAGCLFQLNLLSLTNYYGEGVQKLAEYLLDYNFYDFAGTDLHHDRHLAMLQKLSSSSLYDQLTSGPSLKNQTL